MEYLSKITACRKLFKVTIEHDKRIWLESK
jgi:hypothetical protein